MLESVLLVIFIAITVLYIVWISAIMIPRRKYRTDYTPPVSIIVPAHNEERYIEGTIKSLLGEAYPKKEIIIIDDGSTDKTADIAKRFPVRLLHTNHEGKSAALNKGLRHAKYDVILMLDADSALEKNSLREIVRPLKDKKVGGATGVIRARVTKNPLTWFQDYEYIMSSGWRYTCTKMKGNSILPGFAAFKKSVIKKIGGFSRDTLTEDFDIVVSLRKIGYETVTVSTAQMRTNVPLTIKAFIKQRLRWGRGTLQVMRKHSRFIFSRKSGPLGYFAIPSQFYWYVHAFVYVPIILYMMLVFWSTTVVNVSGYFSLEFIQYIFTMFSVYGIYTLIVKVITLEYAMTEMILFSLTMFFLSVIYTLIVFAKVSRPSIHIIPVYIFFFPFSIFNMLILAASALLAVARPNRRNRWNL